MLSGDGWMATQSALLACREVLYQLQETIIHPHWNESYLNLCRGDTGLMAVHCERRCSSLLVLMF